jgi:hypothetical protein
MLFCCLWIGVKFSWIVDSSFNGITLMDLSSRFSFRLLKISSEEGRHFLDLKLVGFYSSLRFLRVLKDLTLKSSFLDMSDKN